MSKFQPGDIVQVIELGIEKSGRVGSIVRQCSCFHALIVGLGIGQAIYSITCSDKCFVESMLKKIGGERPPAETKADETRDAPVEA